MSRSFDVLVIGGGHAGCEAAAAAARMGARTALVSFDRQMIGAMSCNPAIGGLGKGHLVREADAAAIHYRMLNGSKGAAVQGPRIQADRALFKAAIHDLLAAQDGLEIIEGEAQRLLIADGMVTGFALADGTELSARAVVLATGTFLNGKMFCGEQLDTGGRVGEAAAISLGAQLRALDLPIGRLKTGTPPRLDGRTINWAVLDRQESDGENWTFSDLTPQRAVPQLWCAITRTNPETHAVIRAALDRSPLFSGVIEGQGPRYCPSIEDKIHRFGDRDGHQVFLEPEGLDDPLVYPNGISTSLPADVQLAFLRTMKGLEQVEIAQPGYAVEYDHIDPRALAQSLEIRTLPGVFCAGQINGTTGYEEASAQGLVAGLNAAARALGHAPLQLDRASSYIGVMIDDLVLQGITEPYRMLTARAEYRLRLRADNAATRLTLLALEMGCLSPARRDWFVSRETQRMALRKALECNVTGSALADLGLDVREPGQKQSLFSWMRFITLSQAQLAALCPEAALCSKAIIDELAEDARYAPYIARQEAEIREMRANDSISLQDVDFTSVSGLSNEMVERLNAARPATLGAAERVRGITPAALAAILVQAKRRAA